MSANGNEPPKLGNVEIRRVSGTEWAAQRDGATVASGLTFRQVLAVVRGELAIDALAPPCSNGDPMDKEATCTTSNDPTA